MTDSRIRIAVIGAGRIATRHLAALSALTGDTECVAIVDTDLEAAQRAASQFGVPQVLQSMEDLHSLDGLDAVIICTPNFLHESQAEYAMRAGWDVLLEKPFAETLESGEQLVATAESTGRTLVAGHTFRHVPAIRHLIDTIDNYGRLRAVTVQMCVHWDGPQAPWWAERTPQEGLILSLYAPHALDFVHLATSGRIPTSISVEAAKHQSAWTAEDEAMILLRYPDDILASVHVSYNQPFMVNRRTLHFEDAYIEIEHGDSLRINGEVVVPPVNDGDFHTLGGRSGDHFFISQLQQFVAAIRGEPNYSVGAREAHDIARLNQQVIEVGARSWTST